MPRTTYVAYTYRDGNNYKQSACIALTAPLNPAQQTAILAACDDGEYFIPQQVGMQPLVDRFGGVDPAADHPWHELATCDGSIEQHVRPWGDVTGTFTPEALAEAFMAAGVVEGWKCRRYDPSVGGGGGEDVVIVIRGGIVRSVQRGGRDVPAVVKDYDTRGADPGDLLLDPDGGAYTERSV